MSGIQLRRACVDYPVDRARSRKIVHTANQTLGGRLFFHDKREFVRGLDRINFKVESGQRIGLIGANGGGKTTLLRTLAGILPLASGERVIDGRIATLFSTSAGIDAERTGEENIRRLAALHNLHRSDVPELLESIAEFSELGVYMTMPIKTYSRGMQARLGFAMVTGIPTDIVLIDEVIGVGDSRFYKKARTRFEEFMHNSGSAVIASHSNSLLQTFCRRGVVLKRGRIVFRGSIRDAIAFHEEMQSQPPLAD